MHPDQIREWYNARPFKPFEIVLKDGRTLKVPEPYGLAFPPDGKRLDYSFEDGTWELVPFAEMDEIRALKPKRRIGRGGHRKAS